MRALKSTSELKVKKIESDIYLTWIPNHYGIISPRLKYKQSADGKIKFIITRGQLKSIFINSAISCSVILIVGFVNKRNIDLYLLYLILLEFISFYIVMSFVFVSVTKWKVNKQTKKTRFSGK